MKTFISITIGFVFFANLAVAQMTTFSQGDILSAGAMNQNFKHLQDQFKKKKKEIDCSTDNLTGTINDGYNHIVINGNCSINGLVTGGFDFSRYCGINYEHNPVHFLKIEGKTGKATDSITIGNTGNCNQLVGTFGGWLELSNMSINTNRMDVNDGGLLRIFDSTIDAEEDGDSNRIKSNKATLLMDNVTAEHHLKISMGSIADLINISNASNKDILGNGNSYLNLDNVTSRKIELYSSTVADLENSSINCSESFQTCIHVENLSSINIENSSINSDEEASIVLRELSRVSLKTVTINTNKTIATISVNGPYAYLYVNEETTVPGTVACGQNVTATSSSGDLCE